MKRWPIILSGMLILLFVSDSFAFEHLNVLGWNIDDIIINGTTSMPTSQSEFNNLEKVYANVALENTMSYDVQVRFRIRWYTPDGALDSTYENDEQLKSGSGTWYFYYSWNRNQPPGEYQVVLEAEENVSGTSGTGWQEIFDTTFTVLDGRPDVSNLTVSNINPKVDDVIMVTAQMDGAAVYDSTWSSSEGGQFIPATVSVNNYQPTTRIHTTEYRVPKLPGQKIPLVFSANNQTGSGGRYIYITIQNQFSLTTSSGDGGSVTHPGEGFFEGYNNNTTVPISAQSDTGYRFVNWTGSAVDAGKVVDPKSSSTEFVIDDDYTLQANFEIDSIAKLSLVPSTYEIGFNSTFTVSANINDIEDIYGHELDITFDPQRFEVVSVTEGELLNRNGLDSVYWMPPIIDNVSGMVSNIVNARITPGVGVTGSGVLAYITFHEISSIQSEYSSSISFISSECKLSDPDANTLYVVGYENCAINASEYIDTDQDGLRDKIENSICSDPNDSDTDNDGILDGTEDANHNGIVDGGETDPCNPDSDGDGLQDGTELGLTLDDIGNDTDTDVFIADEDPSSKTIPTLSDSDGDTISDGDEDLNKNGRVDDLEGDPNDNASEPHNAAPTMPSLNYPADQSEVETLTPTLSVNNSTDGDGQDISYEFIVYDAQKLANDKAMGIFEPLVVSERIPAGDETTSWQLQPEQALTDHTVYVWMCRAYDGYEYSSWLLPAPVFGVNISNDAPSVPLISSPPDQSSVYSLQPMVAVNNSTDLDDDPLTYDFEFFSDEGMIDLVASHTQVLEGYSTTQWQIDEILDENSWYWWRARAVDNEGLGSGWTELHSFFVDTANDAPSGLAIVYPETGSEVVDLAVEVKFENAVDPENNPVVYDVQLDTIQSFSGPDLISISDIEGALEGQTIWTFNGLVDNTLYFWRVRANDGVVYSDWVNGSFFVNLMNDSPSTPGVQSPLDGGLVISATPTLIALASTDVDHDDLSYTFEVYGDEELTGLVVSETIDSVEWTVPSALEIDTTYYWRVRAMDEHGAQSSWSPITGFTVKINHAPVTPMINSPVSGGVVNQAQPVLSVLNGSDDDNTALIYMFELYSDPDLQDNVASASIEEGENLTQWQVPITLEGDATYYWRVRVSDGALESSWTATSVFLVCMNYYDVEKNVLAFMEVKSSETADQVIHVNVADASPLHGTEVNINSGALSSDCTIIINEVLNPPSLPDGYVKLGPVLDFSPDGMQFNQPVTIKIPYDPTLFDKANLSDENAYRIWTYDVSQKIWEEITDVDIDTENHVFIFSSNHFSMYVAAIFAPEKQGDSATPKDDGGGGGCFINSLISID